jgi:hypothetical protein
MEIDYSNGVVYLKGRQDFTLNITSLCLPEAISGDEDKEFKVLYKFDVKCFCNYTDESLSIKNRKQHISRALILDEGHFIVACEKVERLACFSETKSLEIVNKMRRSGQFFPNFTNVIQNHIDKETFDGFNDESIISFIDESKNKKLLLKKKDLELCSICEIAHPKSYFKRCAKCKSKRYCGKECQRKDWPIHKKVCVASLPY